MLRFGLPRRSAPARLTAVITAAAWAATLACGCASEPTGVVCLHSSDCESGLCYANKCLAPDGDDDDDGLSNALEKKLRSHPLKKDSDGDGKLDGEEVGADPTQPTDTDFDGMPNIIESLLNDADRDCLPDERDANDHVANTDVSVLKAIACSNRGVCADQEALITATCAVGTGSPAACVYDAVPGFSSVEVCDGKDNDCDGETDEDNTWQGLAIGEACQGNGACGATAATVSCTNGKATCSSNPDGANPAVAGELCDGQDNDCDGETDEDFTIGGLPVGAPCLGRGECGVGVVACGDGGVGLCSTMPGGPDNAASTETCNGKDDDCDGATDEAMLLGELPLGATCTGAGACGEGVVVCGATGATVCSTDPTGPDSQAEAEACNGLDDNCNGQTDEGLEYNSQALGAGCWGIGACGKGKVVCGTDGQATCSTMPSAVNAAPGAVEICNLQDDDCDGQTDEGFSYQGLQQGAKCEGIGACGAGTVECSTTGGMTCSSNPDGSQPAFAFEQCNNVDDDCDGVTDDGVPATFGPKCPANGVCVGHKGAAVCSAGAWSCDFPTSSAFEGAVEQTCDAKDNDCDGVIDEGLPHVWKATTSVFDPGAPAARRLASACWMDTNLYVVGGFVGTVAGGVTSGELWRFDRQTERWALLLTDSQLRTTGAALVCLPAVGTKGARLWRLGGRDALGAPADNVEIALKTLAIGPPSWSGIFTHRDRAKAVIDQNAGRLWLVGRAPSTSQQPLQRLDLATEKWDAINSVAQPTFATGTNDLCATPAGDVHAVSYGDGAGARSHAKLPAGTKQWTTLSAAGEKTGLKWTNGSLCCNSKTVLLVGAKTSQTSQNSQNSQNSQSSESAEYDADAGTWKKAPVLAATAAGMDAFFRADGALSVVGATSVYSPTTGVQSVNYPKAPLAVTDLSAQPAPVRQGRWIATAGALYRVGGMHCSPADPSCDFAGLAGSRDWRLAGGVWTPLALKPDSQPKNRCAPTVVADVDHGRLLLWGGACAHGVATSSAAFSADLIHQKWKALKAKESAGLPVHLQKPQVSRDHPADRAWLYGADAEGLRQVVRVDLGPTPAFTLLWSGDATKGPAPTDDGTMLYDPVFGRLLFFEPGASLRAWTFDLKAAKSWVVAGQDTNIAGGRVRIAGDTTIEGAQLVVAYPHSGPPAQTRTLQLGANIQMHKGAVALGSLSGPFDVVWQRNAKRALLIREDSPTGRPFSAIEQLAWECK